VTKSANCQTKPDTICISITEAKKLLTAAKQKDVLQERIVILNDRIAGLERTISSLNEKDSATVDGYEL
jgi:hypothetical protein